MAQGSQISLPSGAARHVISVDAMGGDRGPAAVVAGLVDCMARLPDLRVLLHGDEAQLTPLIRKHAGMGDRCKVRHAARTVSMTDKPAQVMRHGDGTSMWSCLESVKLGEASAAVSCGNTGALMALSMIRLRKLPGVNRPAIACLWPSRNPGGFNMMLDVGADIRAEADDLIQYAIMGASYAKMGLGLPRPRIGLLNVGTEEHKGRAELKLAHDQMGRVADAAGFSFVGFVEGGDIPSDRVDVIVTDGFTGNIALKTGEGTASLIADFLKQAFNAGLMSKFAAILALNSLKRLQKRIDPRLVNGGVFLGLNGTVVKSHGGADATGISAAIALAFQLAQSGFQANLARLVASAAHEGQDAAAPTSPVGTDTATNNGTTE